MSDHFSDLPMTSGQMGTAMGAIEESLRQKLQQIANGVLILATLFLFIALYSTLQTRNALPGTIGVIFFLLAAVSAFARPLSLHLRSWLLIGAFGMVGVAGLSLQPFTPVGLVFLLASTVLSALLLSQQNWRGVLAVEVSAAVIIAILHSYRILSWESILIEESSVFFWGSLLAVTAFLTWLLASAIASESSILQQWFVAIYQKNEELTRKDETLLQRNAALEQQLDRKKYLSITARQIAREISQQPDPLKVMQTTVDLINQQMNYYHTGIFLKDERSEFAVLKAGTGEPGAEMLARQHKLRVREEGVVGYVVARGEIRIASEVSRDAFHYKNPSLPLTQSEMAVPLLIGDTVIGALDVQSTQPNSFDEDEVDFLQTVATSLAVSVHRSTQSTALERELSEIKQKEHAANVKSWQTHLKGSRKKFNYRYSDSKLLATNGISSEMKDALSSGTQEVKPIVDQNAGVVQAASVAVPIKLRGQVLGMIHLKVEGQQTPSEIIQLVNTASDRLALALENARLLEEIQERAEREHLVADISDRVRSETDIDSILRTTVQELGKTLSVGEVRIQLKTRDTQ